MAITPFKNDNILDRVTTFDLVLIRKHILNLQKLDSPCKLIAADANNSGTITTADMLAIRKVVLHITDTFPNNTSWRFIPANYEFPDPTNPFIEEFPEQLDYNLLDSSQVNQDYIGIKIGDINGSADPRN